MKFENVSAISSYILQRIDYLFVLGFKLNQGRNMLKARTRVLFNDGTKAVTGLLENTYIVYLNGPHTEKIRNLCIVLHGTFEMMPYNQHKVVLICI